MGRIIAEVVDMTNKRPAEVLHMHPVEREFLMESAMVRLENRPTTEFFAKLFGAK